MWKCCMIKIMQHLQLMMFPWHKLSVFHLLVCILLLISAEKLKEEIEMRPNQAYETVSRPCPSRSATQIHTERCVAYDDVIVQACN